ncbi:MAG: hypothetical protein A2664_01160 [Candidatus Taylorbacteria bacterium RIFCSPHIGHO2_01_FULL_46_22b]|uniref:Uncharacterized protein n=1 Tax=Candidatus Taylorbacteria bacterium RIFCSPHIGHO2_01_FULL_46_22b TaxID=1802301 RepID=A0A1G2M295_9BACT|nr:MAG: hypothetical protein A2664_01160 [Candidatus Taylorbacteria bacterium RIFCSPHIGHO2_01_FULL_46_22b]
MPPEKTNSRAEEVKALRTFETDVAEALTEGKTSSAKIFIAENAKPRGEREQSELPKPPDHSARNKLLLIMAGIVAFAGLVVFVSYLLLKPAPRPTAPTTTAGKTIIAIDSTKTININGLTQKKTLEAIKQERDNITLRLNAIEGVTFTQVNNDGFPIPIDAPTFLLKIAPSMPASFIRALDPSFAFGFIGLNGNQPFIIFRTGAFEQAYAGMLTGEIDFYREAGDMFGTSENSMPVLATSTAAYFGLDPNTRVFHDVVVKNIDTRAVKDSAGAIVLMYGFVDQYTLVITTNVNTFNEIVVRLKRSRLIP